MADRRYTITEAARLLKLHPSHLRRLWRQGILPLPLRTVGQKPYYDDGLLATAREVMKTGIGLNGQEHCFYSKNRKAKPKARRQARPSRQRKPAKDPYIGALIAGLTQLGVSPEQLGHADLDSLLRQRFSNGRPELSEAVLMLARELLPRTQTEPHSEEPKPCP